LEIKFTVPGEKVPKVSKIEAKKRDPLEIAA
jgi:hypothetical protein